MSEREPAEGSEPETFPASPAGERFPAERETPSAERETVPAERETAPGYETPGEHGAPEREVGEEPVAAHERAPNMLPGRARRGSGLERLIVRVVATGGIIGIGVAVAAILGANNVQAWITGLVVSALSVVLAAILWSSQRL